MKEKIDDYTDEYLYHYMSQEEYDNYINKHSIILKQPNSWRKNEFIWEDPFLEVFGIVGNKKIDDVKQLKKIDEFFDIYLKVYKEILGSSEINYSYIFTDILNFISFLYTTYASCWTRSEYPVGDDKKYYIKISNNNLKELKKEGYNVTLSKMQYYNYTDIELENRIRKVMDRDGIRLKEMFLQLPIDYEEEQEERIILTPKQPKFPNKSFDDSIANKDNDRRKLFNKAILTVIKEIKEDIDKQYKKDHFGNIIELEIPKKIIIEESEIKL